MVSLAHALWLALAVDGGTSENPHLARGIEQVEKLDEAAALRTLEQAKHWPASSPRELARVHLYIGLAHAGLADERAAVRNFEIAVAIDAQVRLPVWASPQVRSFWTRAGGSLVPVPDASADAGLTMQELTPPLEVRPSPVVEAPTAAPARARWPRVAGVAALVAGVLGVGGGVWAGLRSQAYSRAADAEDFGTHSERYQRFAVETAQLANILYVVGGVLMGAGILALVLSLD